uniref:Ig-like domain-containing protein n=1 Tax=Stegastes partitus TaxID=144197 RepID=A0A3B5AVZ8_9TELE
MFIDGKVDDCAMYVFLPYRISLDFVPLPAVRQPPTIIKQSMKEHIVDPKDTMVIECEAKGNPHPIFSWRRNGKYFNVARDSQASMRRRSGTLDIYARNNPEQYEAEYQCIASNEYGSAYSNKIRLQLYRAPVWPREILEPVVVSAGLPLVLSCDPPPGPPKPETYWMSSCKCLIHSSGVSMGVNGDLYFSNVLINDSVADYCCNARFPYKNVIQQKMPVVVKVLSSEYECLQWTTRIFFFCYYLTFFALQKHVLVLTCVTVKLSETLTSSTSTTNCNRFKGSK